MKKATLFLSLFFLSYIVSFSQSFETFYSNQYKNFVGWGTSIDDDNNYYITTYDVNTSGNSETWGGIIKLNPQGEIVDSLKLPQQENFSTYMVGKKMYYLNNHLYCFGPKRNLITDETIFYGLKVDLELNIVDSLVIPMEAQYRVFNPRTVEMYDGKFYLIANFKDSTVTTPFFASNGIFMIEIAEDFSNHQFTFSTDNDDNGYVHDFVKKQDGNFLLACFPTWRYNFSGPNTGNVTLSTFNEELNPISTSEINASMFYNAIDIDTFQDSLFLVSGNKYISEISDTGMGIYVINSNQTILDSLEIHAFEGADTLERTCSQCLDQFDENNIYFGSIKKSYGPTQPTTSPNWIRLVKFDAELNIIWERFYGGDRANYIYGVTATPDGGCIILCDYYDYELYPDFVKTSIRIIKVDGNGDVTSLDENNQLQIRSLLLYPNPSNGRAFLDTSLQDYYIQFYDSQSRMVYETRQLSGEQELNLYKLPVGMYTYIVYNKENKQEDSGKLLINK